jgi:hypothetical protein
MQLLPAQYRMSIWLYAAIIVSGMCVWMLSRMAVLQIEQYQDQIIRTSAEIDTRLISHQP